MAKAGFQGMDVGGVQKISLWKYEESYGKWVEIPNLPATYLDLYLQRGFRKSPPEETKSQESDLFDKFGQEAIKSQKKV